MAEELAQIFQVIEGGAQVAADNIVQFPVDAAGAAAETALAGEGTTTVAQLGNGAAAEVSQLTVIEGGASTATTSGLGILAMDVGAVGAAIAPALGIVAGIGLYNLAPEFWTNVSNSLVAAGQTVGGKVRTFLNGDTKQLGLSQDTIEIFKNAFLEAGLFETPDIPAQPTGSHYSFINTDSMLIRARIMQEADKIGFHKNEFRSAIESALAGANFNGYPFASASFGINSTGIVSASIRKMSSTCDYINMYADATSYTIEGYTGSIKYYNYKNSNWDWVYRGHDGSGDPGTATVIPATGAVNSYIINLSNEYKCLTVWCSIANVGTNENIQEGATLPNTNPFPATYPEWLPWTAPTGVPWPASLPDIFPIEMPDLYPDIQQDEAQNPDPNPDPAPWLQFILDNVAVPDPITDPEPAPVPTPDPDPQPEPEPLPDTAEEEVDPDPPDPNPDPPTPPLPIITPLPDMVPSNAMFTVYRPSISQLNSFGGWLWNNSIIEQILKMWQNPLDGIIAFMKVYADPSIGATTNIQVGYLDSGVPAPIVTSQFTTVDCGSVQINETKRNATDYSPYTSLHLYLPFIGIVELDSDEFMDGTISVLYHIDVYTGTCLAEVKCTRTVDMPNPTIIYTFSGNASQQLPLTSSSFAGALSALVSAVGGGIAIASGGGVGALAGGVAIGHSLTHEMVHIGHSGALSANAGIMASRKPYVIISRKHGYDANAYNELYGFPTNKTVFLGNCSGFTRVKAGRLRSEASEKEKDEIMSLLKEGVIL